MLEDEIVQRRTTPDSGCVLSAGLFSRACTSYGKTVTQIPSDEKATTIPASNGAASLSEFRRRKLLRRAHALTKTDPKAALRTVHELLDGGAETSETYELESKLLLSLGCGTIAARAAENSIRLGGDRLSLMILLLKCHLTAFNRKPASQVIDALLSMEPLPDEAKAEIAHGAQEIHRYDVAKRLYDELLERDATNVKNWINVGYAEQKNGNMVKAETCYRRAIAVKPDSANAARLLASVRKQMADDNCLHEIKEAMARVNPQSEEYVTAAYALGKTYEDLGDYENAYAVFKAGADVMRPKMPYSTGAIKSAFAATREYFRHPAHLARAAQRLKAFRAAPEAGPQPLFILGMPRTGSTLLDRMTSSHSDVRSMGELGCFKEVMKVLTGFGGGEGFHEHFYAQPERDIDLAALGRLYTAAAAPDDFSGRYYTDKYPMNFMDLGLIAAALPGAKFVHTIRNPMDTIFGNFKQLFTLGFYHYSYDLAECAEYFIEYQEMMAFWESLAPDRILEVGYEDVVADPQREVARVLGFLGLEWEAACLDYHNSDAPVDTASLSQVRQPIYKSAVGHWTRYGDLLDDAAEVLWRNGIDLGESRRRDGGAKTRP